MVVMKYPNGDKYDGEWEDDMKHGEGTLYYANGGNYEGNWANDLREGYGVNSWPNGDRYEGNWRKNKKHGKGKYIYSDGGIYNGQWKNDMRNGYGVNTWANGNSYKGDWVNNQQNGKGKITYRDGGKYEGDWKENMRDGYGINTWSKGDRYEGNWKYSKKHGEGTFYHADGSKKTGTWQNDKLVSNDDDDNENLNANALKPGTMKVNSRNATEIKGLWVNGIPFLFVLFPKSDTCPYLLLAREYLKSLQWNQTFFNSNHDHCYCPRCYKESWDDVIDAGDDKYVIPRGWIRLGLHLDQVFMKANDVWKKWIVTFHGTSKIAAQSIIEHRQFCLPGDTLIDGTKLKIRPGHIPNKHFVYTSPTIAYSSGPAYSPAYDFHSTENDADYQTQLVLQCRQKPNSYDIGPETIGAGNTKLCRYIPNSKIEYFTERRSSLLAYGLLVRFRPKSS